MQLKLLWQICFPLTAAFSNTVFKLLSFLKISLILPSLAAKVAAGSSLQGHNKSCFQDVDEKCSALPTLTSDSVHKTLAEGLSG